jgi:hypothetical protein
MRRSLRIAVLVVAALAGGLVTGRSVVPPKTSVEVEVESGLDRPIALLQADGMPLNKVIDALIEQSHANLVVSWHDLEAGGVDAQAPVKLRLENVKLRVVLARVLEQVGGGTVKLGYEVRDGVIDVSTEEALSRFTVTRMYDIRDIVDAVIQEHKRWPVTTAPASPTSGGGALFSGQPHSLLASGSRNDGDQVIEDIVKLTTDTVRPDSWRDAGGTAGSIRSLGGHLIVTQTSTAHTEIARLLDQLRAELRREPR